MVVNLSNDKFSYNSGEEGKKTDFSLKNYTSKTTEDSSKTDKTNSNDITREIKQACDLTDAKKGNTPKDKLNTEKAMSLNTESPKIKPSETNYRAQPDL